MKYYRTLQAALTTALVFSEVINEVAEEIAEVVNEVVETDAPIEEINMIINPSLLTSTQMLIGRFNLFLDPHLRLVLLIFTNFSFFCLLINSSLSFVIPSSFLSFIFFIVHSTTRPSPTAGVVIAVICFKKNLFRSANYLDTDDIEEFSDEEEEEDDGEALPISKKKAKKATSAQKKRTKTPAKKKTVKKKAVTKNKDVKYTRTTTLVEATRHPETDKDVSLVLRPKHRTSRRSNRSPKSSRDGQKYGSMYH